MKTKIHSPTIFSTFCTGTLVCKSQMAKHFIGLQFGSYVGRII